MRIVLTGGGTGGHLTPLVAAAAALREIMRERTVSIPASRNSSIELLYVGVVTDMDRQFLEVAKIPAIHIPSGKIRRYLSGAGLTLVDVLWRLPWGTLRALWTLYALMPEVVFSKGGYGSIPVVLVAWLYHIPVLLHETDVVPGLANRWLARYVSAIAVNVRTTEQYFPEKKVFVAGTPLRPMFFRQTSRESARQALGLHDRKSVLFVTGGSQGAQKINTVVLELLLRLLPEFQVVHQVGGWNLEPIQAFVRDTLKHVPDVSDYHATGFLDEAGMVNAFTAADLVICRSGGTTLAELSAIGRPAILIPLHGAANNHQWENAYLYREAGAAAVLDETNLSPPLLEATIQRLFQRPDDLRLMASRIRGFARPSAAEDLARLVVAMGSGYVPRRVVAGAQETSGGRE